MNAKQMLIGMLEEDILKTDAAMISINVDLVMVKGSRTILEGEELEEADKKVKDLGMGLLRMVDQKKLLSDKLKLVKAYSGDTKAEVSSN